VRSVKNSALFVRGKRAYLAYMRNLLGLLSLIALTACQQDESVSKFAVAFTSRATIAFPKEGEVVGQAPCNRYFATQTVPYPWFALSGIGATRMACPELEAESAFFAALEDMSLVEIVGPTLILTNEAGREMVFEAR